MVQGIKNLAIDSELYKSELLLDEARFGYKKVDTLLAKTKERSLLLLSAEVVVLTFLAGGLALRELGGTITKVFAFAGCFGVLASIFMLIYVASTISDWPTPVSEVERINVKNSADVVEAVSVIADDYNAATVRAYEIVEKRIKVFGISLIIFVVCATILFTINLFR